MEFKILILSFLGGILPALIWLLFWLKEDKDNPEPVGLIALTFIAGMVAVILAPPLQNLAFDFVFETIPLVLIWAGIEEILKLVAVWLVALKTSEINEPIDYVIYFIAVALGFSAIENSLFLINPISEGNILEAVFLGNMRFLGTTLIHVISSSVIGVALALTFYKKRILKTINLFFGLLAAIFLHSLFNFFIIEGEGENIFAIFSIIWITAIIMILYFQKVKKIEPKFTK